MFKADRVRIAAGVLPLSAAPTWEGGIQQTSAKLPFVPKCFIFLDSNGRRNIFLISRLSCKAQDVPDCR